MVLHVITVLLSVGLCFGMPPASNTKPAAYSASQQQQQAAQASLFNQQPAQQTRGGLFPQQPPNPSYQPQQPNLGSFGASLFGQSPYSAARSQQGGLLGQAAAGANRQQATNAGAGNLMSSILQNTMTGRMMGLDSQEIAYLNSVRTQGVRRANIDRLMKIDQIPSYNYYLSLKNNPAQFAKAQGYLMRLNTMERVATDAQLETMGLRMMMQPNQDPVIAGMLQMDAARGVYGDALQRLIQRRTQMSVLG
ncbi:uncharacterized protein 1-like [Haliotis rufescens]|uniref:uncharacterized protein 1-like n=1 Tax=Haliotis rufescens TaxID=6454 RepID=UPI001EB00CD1|nr:uncharacterized protein 1-like [Haliotis rufescens]